MKLKFEIGGVEYEIEATRQGERLLVELEGKQYELSVTQGQDGVLRMQNGQRQVQIVGAKRELQRQVAVKGRTLRYRRVSEQVGGRIRPKIISVQQSQPSLPKSSSMSAMLLQRVTN